MRGQFWALKSPSFPALGRCPPAPTPVSLSEWLAPCEGLRRSAATALVMSQAAARPPLPPPSSPLLPSIDVY